MLVGNLEKGGMIVDHATLQTKDDVTLVDLAKDGDFAAFDLLTTRHEQRLYSVALHLVRERNDAEDVVQTAFINALEHLDSFRGEAQFSTWITRICVNAALKALRRRKGQGFSLDEATSEREDGIIPHPEYLAEWKEDPARLAEKSELKDLLENATDQLPEKLKSVFVLRDIESMSVAETAKLLDISDANVKVRLLRARLAMREALNRVFGDDTRRVHANAEQNEHMTVPAEALLKSYLTE